MCTERLRVKRPTETMRVWSYNIKCSKIFSIHLVGAPCKIHKDKVCVPGSYIYLHFLTPKAPKGFGLNLFSINFTTFQ
jgi:hypothetical protein